MAEQKARDDAEEARLMAQQKALVDAEEARLLAEQKAQKSTTTNIKKYVIEIVDKDTNIPIKEYSVKEDDIYTTIEENLLKLKVNSENDGIYSNDIKDIRKKYKVFINNAV